MSIQSLRDALSEGDLEATRAALKTLDGSDSLAAFMAAYENREHASAGFEVFRWISELPPPEGQMDRENWLRALNNACALAIQHPGDDEARLTMARRAMSFGSQNIAIFHNAACVFCSVGELEEALDAVAAAVDHGYGSATMVDDPDLDAIRHTDDFADAIGGAREADEAAHRRKLEQLSTALFGGAEVPEDLDRIWRRQLAITGARAVDDGGIARLYEEPKRPALLVDPDAALAALVEATDWVAKLSPAGWIGYFRGPDRTIAPTEAPVVGIDPQGEHRVTADVYDQLRLAAVGDRTKLQGLREMLIMLRLDDTDPSTDGVDDRAATARAVVESFLAGR